MNFIQKIQVARVTKKFRKKVNEFESQYILSAIEKGQTALDVGAHVGGFTYYMQQAVGKNGKIFSFEPQSTPRKLLLHHKELLQWDNVVVVNSALSNSIGSTTLHVPSYKGKEDTEAATILVRPDQEFYTTEKVTTDTIDSYCQQHNLSPGFIKIDVEGNELKVVQGALEIINKCSPKFFVEIEARHSGEYQAFQTVDFLMSKGYKCIILDKDHWVVTEQADVEQAIRVRYCNNFVFEKK